MTEKNGTANFDSYADGWAQMMITIWKEKMRSYGIGITGALESSLQTEVARQAGGNTAKIRHFFLYYGIYAARGVGREFKEGRYGRLDFTPKRKPKPWLYGKYWHSKQKLAAEMIAQTGSFYLVSLSEVFTGKP